MTKVGSAQFDITANNAQAIRSVRDLAREAQRLLGTVELKPTVDLRAVRAELAKVIQAAQGQTLKIPTTPAPRPAAPARQAVDETGRTAAQVLADHRRTLALNQQLARDTARAQAQAAQESARVGREAARAMARAAQEAARAIARAQAEATRTQREQQRAQVQAARDAAREQTRLAQESVRAQAQADQTAARNFRDTQLLNQRLAREAAQGQLQSVQQLARELQLADSRYARGADSLRTYLREMERIRTTGIAMGEGLQAGSREAQQLERVMKGLSAGAAKLNSDSITKLRSDLQGARAEYEKAIGAAGRFNFVGQHQATRAYEAELAKLEGRIRSIGERATVTANQTKALTAVSQQIASQQNAMNGVFSKVGLGGNLSNVLRSLPQFAAEMGGSLGAAFSGVQQLSGGLTGLAALGGPVGLALGAVTVALVGLTAGLGKAIAEAEVFEKGMGQISTLTDKFPQQLGDVSQGLLQMSAGLGKPLGDLQQGLYDVLGAGVRGSEQMSSSLTLLQTAAKLAVAGATDTKTATDVLTSSLNAYGLSADKAGAVSNKLFQAVLDGKMEFSQLAQSLGMVTPMAAQAGVSFDEVLAALAAMTKQGIKPSTAVEYLRSALTNIIKPSEQASKQAAAIGLQFDNAALRAKGFTAFLQDVMVKTKGNTGVLSRLIGDVGGLTAVLSLGAGGMKSYVDILGSVEKATTTTDVAYAKATDNARHAADRLAASWKVLLTVVGTPFLEAKKNLLDFTTSAVQSFTAFVQGGQAAGRTGVVFQQWTQTMRTALAPVAGFVRDVFAAIAVAWNTVLRPVLTVIGQAWMVLQTVVMTALGVLLNVVRSAFNGVAGLLAGFVNGFTRSGQGVKVNLTDMSARFATWAEMARAYITGVGKVAGLLPRAFGEAGRGIGLIFAGINKIFAGFGLVAYDSLVKPVLPVLATVRDAFRGMAEQVAEVVGKMLTWVGEKLAPFAEGLKAIGVGIGESVLRMVSGLAGGLRERLFGKDDSQDAALRAQADAARKVAQEQSGGAKLVQQGLKDIKAGYGDVRGAVTQFGEGARKVWASVGEDLKKVRTEAQGLRQDLNKEFQVASTASAPGRLVATSLPDASPVPEPPKSTKNAPVTVEDLNNLDAYKRKLDAMNLAELQREKLFQTRLKDTKRLGLVLSEIHQREREGAAAAKKAAAERLAAIQTADRLGRQFQNLNQDFGLRLSKGTVTPEQLLNYRQAVASLRAEIGKLPQDQRSRFADILGQASEFEQRGRAVVLERQRAAEYAAEVKKLSAAVKGWTDAELASARARVAGDASRRQSLELIDAEIAKRRDLAVVSHNKLATRFQNLNEDFAVKLDAGKVDEAALTNYRQALTALRSDIAKLPPDLRALYGEIDRQADSFLASGRTMADARRQAADYKASLGTLKDALEGMSDAELQSRLASEQGTDTQGQRLKLLEAEIERRRKLRDVTLEQGRLALQKGDAQAVVENYEARKAAAQGNAQELLRIEQDLGTEVLAARQRLAQIAAREEILQIQERYRGLREQAKGNAATLLALDEQEAAATQQARDRRDATQLANRVASDQALITQTRDTTAELVRLANERFDAIDAVSNQGAQRTLAGYEMAGARAGSGGTEDLTERLRVERELGEQVVVARQDTARRAADAEIRVQTEKYRVLLEKEKQGSDEYKRLQNELTQWTADRQGLLETERERLAWEGAQARIRAEKAVTDAILNLNRSLIDGLNQRAQSEADRKRTQFESDVQDELRAVGDNEAAKLQILQREQGVRELLARQSVNARLASEREAEMRRFADLQKSSEWTAADQALREKLTREHQARLTEIATQGEADKDAAIRTLRREAEEQQSRTYEQQAQREVKVRTRNLNDLSVAERATQRTSLQGWLRYYESLGAAGQAAAKAIRDALDQVAQADTDARQRAVDLADGLFEKDGDGRDLGVEQVRRRLADRTAKIGKPEGREDAGAKGREAFSGELAALKKGIEDANKVIAELGTLPASSLNALETQRLQRARDLLALFEAQLPRTQQAAATAGRQAADAYGKGLREGLANLRREVEDLTTPPSQARAAAQAEQPYRDQIRKVEDAARAAQDTVNRLTEKSQREPLTADDLLDLSDAQVSLPQLQAFVKLLENAMGSAGRVAGRAFASSAVDEAAQTAEATATATFQLAQAAQALSSQQDLGLTPQYRQALDEYRAFWKERMDTLRAGLTAAQAEEARLTAAVQSGTATAEEAKAATARRVEVQGQLTQATQTYVQASGEVRDIDLQRIAADRALRDARQGLMGVMGLSVPQYQSEIDQLTELIRTNKDHAAQLTEVLNRYKELQRIRSAGVATKESIKLDVQTGFNSGAANLQSAVQNVAQGLGQVMNPLNLFAEILNKINPAGMILEGMFSVLEEPIKALQEPFKVIGTLIGSVLAPVLELLAPILTAVANVFVMLYDALAEFVKMITFGLVNIDRRTPAEDKQEGGGKGSADLKGENDNRQLELDYKAGRISRQKYEEEKLRLLRNRLDREMAAEIASAEESGLDVAEIRRKYALQWEEESAAIREQAAQRERDLVALLGETALKELDRQLRAGEITRRQYDERALALLKERLDREEADAVAAAQGSEAEIAAVREKYRLLRLEEEAKLRATLAQQDKDLLDLQSDNDQKELDRRLRQGLISGREHAEASYRLTLSRLARERAAEIAAAEGDQRKILEINRKYDGLLLDAKLDMLDKLSEAFRAIGDTLLSSITGSVRDGLLGALRAGNFGQFRAQFRRNMRQAMFEAVLGAAIETAAIKGILQPAINALTAAMQTEGTADDDAAIRGLLEAGSRVEGVAARIYRAMKPLRDAWGIKDEGSQGSSMEVTGKIDTPEVRISLEMLSYLAETIGEHVPPWREALLSHIPALNGHSPALTAHTPALAGHTAGLAAHLAALSIHTPALSAHVPVLTAHTSALPQFSTAVDQFGLHEQAYQAHVGSFGEHVGAFGGHVAQFGQHVRVLAAAAQQVGGSGFTPKR